MYQMQQNVLDFVASTLYVTGSVFMREIYIIFGHFSRLQQKMEKPNRHTDIHTGEPIL